MIDEPSFYPLKLHALENERHELVVRKLAVEMELRKLKDKIRERRAVGADVSTLVLRRDECLTELNTVMLRLAELRVVRHSDVGSYKTAFLKMAKKILPRDQYRSIALAADKLVHAKSPTGRERDNGND
jgi:hypothetical protein